MWWLPLALGAGKSVLDNQANKQRLASEVITQKYSPWTGQQADFSMQGKNSFGDNMMKGAAGALMDYQAGKAAEAAKEAQTMAQHKADGAWYEKSGGFMSPKASVAKSSFDGVPTRAPATTVAPAPAQAPVASASFADLFPVRTAGETPMPMQVPQDPSAWWQQLSQIQSAPYSQPKTATVPALATSSNWARFR